MRQRPSKQIVPRPAGQSAHRSASRTPVGYPALLEDIKSRIRTAQIKASLSVNRELIQLYWSIGRDIAVKQEYQGWGAKVIDRLAADLQREFPGLSGFSRGNVYRMRAFYLAYGPSRQFLAQPARQLIGAKAARTIKRSDPQLSRNLRDNWVLVPHQNRWYRSPGSTMWY